ncbi:unnamed protein product [Discosporangium mesarthrocarpum]
MTLALKRAVFLSHLVCDSFERLESSVVCRGSTYRGDVMRLVHQYRHNFGTNTHLGVHAKTIYTRTLSRRFSIIIPRLPESQQFMGLEYRYNFGTDTHPYLRAQQQEK